MKRLAKLVAVGATLAPAIAAASPDSGTSGTSATSAAQPAPTSPTSTDLHVHHLPTKLKMRTAAKPANAENQDGPAAASGGTGGPKIPEAPAAATFTALPSSSRDFDERVTYRIRAGVDGFDAPSSGETLRGGAQLPSGFSNTRLFNDDEVMLGARGIVLPSLGGYFLGSLVFDTLDAQATRTAVVVPGDSNDQRFAVKAGYAEYGNDDRHPDSLWVRAGRQFRLDAGAIFAYFDGVTVGYRTPGVEMSGFIGQRAVLYVDSTPGVEFGATAAIDLNQLRIAPVRLSLDYMGLSIDVPNAMNIDQNQLRQLVSLIGSYEPSKSLRVDLNARAVNGGQDGQSFGLGRVGARIKLAPSESLIVIADVEQRQSGDLAYDLAAPAAADVLNVAHQVGVGLVTPVNSVTVGAHVDWRNHTGTFELLAFGRADVTEQTPTFVDQEGWVEGGGAVAGQIFKGGWLTAQYTGRHYTRVDAANLQAAAFDDTAGSGLSTLHEIAVDATLRSQGRGTRWRAGAGVFYRIFNLITPYEVADNDGRGGGRLDGQYWFTQRLHFDAAVEVAQPSAVLAREIGTMTSVRASLEARW